MDWNARSPGELFWARVARYREPFAPRRQKKLTAHPPVCRSRSRDSEGVEPGGRQRSCGGGGGALHVLTVLMTSAKAGYSHGTPEPGAVSSF